MNDILPPLVETIAGADLAQWYQVARSAAIAAEVDPAELDWLLQGSTDLDRLALRLGSFQQRPTIPSRLSLTGLQVLWQKRLSERIPVQHLLGYTGWRDLILKVTPDVLIPRPETELMVDIALVSAQESPQAKALLSGNWVDVGTGSGAIAIALALALPLATIYAIDTSPAALAVARTNAHNYQLGERLRFLQGAWLAPLEAFRGLISAIVSNPPYIPSRVVLTLEPEVRCHEPTLALDGGEDGLAAIRALVHQAPAYLCAGGLWMTELMQGQAQTVATLLEQQGSYRGITIYPDLSGIERFVLAYRQ